MLRDEVEKRTGLRWQEGDVSQSNTAIVFGTQSQLAAEGYAPAQKPEKAEGYSIAISSKNGETIVAVSGYDNRGVLFGVGRLLREFRMTRGAVTLDASFHIVSSPAYPLRGHQMGYRPKVNTYDAWTPKMYEQYIRDLVVFGTNAIELIPPRSDDAPTSPHFVMPQIKMIATVSQLAKDYGIEFWMWYPAMDRDYSKPATVQHALKEWGAVFEQIPYITAVFVPGGDPGHTEPKYLLPLLEKETAVLHKTHPNAQMWMSPQSFNKKWMDEFLDIMQHQQPDYLSGIVFGPQSRLSLPELRKAIPAKYPIRRYPDITHSIRCQYPVPEWDVAYPLTENREVINPRPTQYANIFRLWDKDSCGFLTYSEGVNDDANKILWSSLGWNPDEKVIDVLRSYARYFIGPEYEDTFAQQLLSLERDWEGPLLTNRNVRTTLQKAEEMDKDADPHVRLNWRFQQMLYRSYYDAYVQQRLIYETNAEDRAMDVLRKAKALGSELALNQAEAILNKQVTNKVARDLRARVFEMAEALYQSIHMQLSVPRYQAISVDRGANLDLIDTPLNNHDWLLDRFAEIRKLPNEYQRQKAIDAIVNWTNPGPGGFYDDLGNPSAEPHLVRLKDPMDDPEHRVTPLNGFDEDPGFRISWVCHGESIYDAPLQMHYDNLDTNATYTLKIIYAGDKSDVKVRCVADDGVEIQPFMNKPWPMKPIEFAIPQSVTSDGDLTLTWYQEPGTGHSGRGCQIAEVWLIRK